MKKKQIFLLLSLIILWIFLSWDSQPKRGSSFSAQMYGSRAFLLTLQQLGIQSKPWLYPFSELKNRATDATLLVISPSGLETASDLLRWVESGNRLIFLSSNPDSYKPILAKTDISIKDDIAYRLIASPTRQFSKVSCPADNLEVCKDVNQVTTSNLLFAATSKTATSVASQDNGVSIFHYRLGAGDIWLFAGDDTIVNRNIDQNDNLRFLYQLVTARSSVFFDEFHHGYRAPAPVEQQNSYATVWLLFGLLFILLSIFAISRAVRFGPVELETEQTIPGSTDFVTALGSLLQEHGIRPALRYYLQAWKERAANKFCISRNLEDEVFFKKVGEILSKEDMKYFDQSIASLRNVDVEINGAPNSTVIGHLEKILEIG